MKYVRDWGLVLALASVACSNGGKPKEAGCKPDDLSSCDDGLVCEQLGSADEYACLSPVMLRGRVFDALDGTGIPDATVVGLDANGAARTRLARTDAQGNYELPVRDPDQGIGGTEVVFVDVGAGAAEVTLDESFKVTEALRVVGPGAESPEQMRAGEVMLSWADDSSEDGYELRVYDALGTLVHEDTAVPLVTGSADVRYALDASAFEPGMLYQFRVWSWRARQAQRTYISASEDLRGVFEIAR